MNLKKGFPEPIFITGEHNIVHIILLILNCMKNHFYHSKINNNIIYIK